jgi:hypothetical protein
MLHRPPKSSAGAEGALRPPLTGVFDLSSSPIRQWTAGRGPPSAPTAALDCAEGAPTGLVSVGKRRLCTALTSPTPLC